MPSYATADVAGLPIPGPVRFASPPLTVTLTVILILNVNECSVIRKYWF